MDSFEVTSDARKCFSTPNESFQSQLLTIWNRKCPLSLICSCSFWPLAPGSVLSTYTRSMESLLVLTSGRKLPLCSMDEAILISFRKQAKFCMESTPSSFVKVNESLRQNRCCVIVLDVSNTLLHITQPDSLEHLGFPMQTEPQTQNLKPSLVAPHDVWILILSRNRNVRRHKVQTCRRPRWWIVQTNRTGFHVLYLMMIFSSLNMTKLWQFHNVDHVFIMVTMTTKVTWL